MSVSYSPAFSVNAAADHPQDKALSSRVEIRSVENLNPGVELGPGLKILLCNREVELDRGLKILLCNRFNTGLKLFMSKNERFFLLLGINAEELIAFQSQGCAPEPEAPECQHILPEPDKIISYFNEHLVLNGKIKSLFTNILHYYYLYVVLLYISITTLFNINSVV